MHDQIEVTRAEAVRTFELNGRLELRVTFSDGMRKVVDVKPLLTGIRQRLLRPDQFAQARVEAGVVVWPGERIRPDQAHITDLTIETRALYALEPIDG